MPKTVVVNNIDYRDLDYEDVTHQDLIQKQTLDDILSLSEPYRTAALSVWIEGFEHVNIKATKTPFKGAVKHNGRWREFTIPPRGRGFDRANAVDVLMRYGVRGQYRGKDQRTGISNQYLEAATADDRAYWKERGIEHIEDIYLYHDNKQVVEEPEAEAA